MEWLESFARLSATLIEALGIAVIVAATLYSLGSALVLRVKGADNRAAFYLARHRLAHGILLGLELLVAADIINTVVIGLDFASVGVLAVIVLIRTFLSFSLEVEMNGRWPWQAGERHARNP